MNDFVPNPKDYESTDSVPTIVETLSPPTVENHLGAIIPSARGRKIAYAIYAATALVVGNAAVGFAAAGFETPVWLTVAAAVVANLAAPFSALAIANAKK